MKRLLMTGFLSLLGIALVIFFLSSCSKPPREYGTMEVEIRSEYGDYGSDYEVYDESDRKIIKTSNIDLETTAFDTVSDNMKTLAESYGGYTESSSAHTYRQNGKALLRAQYTLRVPPEFFDEIKEFVEALGTVTASSTLEENVTDEYCDLAARLSAKEAVEERLLAMIADTVSISDLILLEERLSETRGEIEILRSRLTGIDRLSSFPAINVMVSEVLSDTNDSLSSRIARSFLSSIDGVISFCESLLILAAGLILPVSIIAVVICCVVFVLRKIKPKNMN